MSIVVSIPRESEPDHRVAITPAQVPKLTAAGVEVRVESGAGVRAGFGDGAYEERGATLALHRSDVFACDVVLQVRVTDTRPDELGEHQTLIGLADPLTSLGALEALATKGATIFALELLPRITRAQSMDVLSSMATLAGYKAVLVAADRLPRILPMMVTAAGTLAPAKALIIGAGVAGLQAAATAKRLGAVVTAYDVRPEVREEVESVGARFADLGLDTAGAQDARGYARGLGDDFYRRQRELMTRLVSDSDLVITTAAVPGRDAPRLITEAMVEGMRSGSVIVDLAAASGGNCELTRADETVVRSGVSIVGPTNLPATLPYHASQMYGNNIVTFVLSLLRDGAVTIDTEDEIVRETLVATGGRIVNPRLLQRKSE